MPFEDKESMFIDDESRWPVAKSADAETRNRPPSFWEEFDRNNEAASKV